MSNSEEFFEPCPDLLNFCDHLTKCSRDIQGSGLTLEHYLKSQLDIHIHYVLRGADKKPRNLCAILKPDERDCNRTVENYSSIFDGLGVDEYLLHDGNGWQQELVLVHDVEIMKEAKNIPIPTQSVIVRLQSFDFCQGNSSDPILEFLYSPLKSGSIFEDRKIHGGGVALDTRGVVSFNQGPEDVIKRRSCIVQAVPDHQRPSHNIGFLRETDEKDKLPGLWINILDDRVCLSFSTVGRNRIIEGLKVLLCSPNLGEKTVRQFSYVLPPWMDE